MSPSAPQDDLGMQPHENSMMGSKKRGGRGEDVKSAQLRGGHRENGKSSQARSGHREVSAPQDGRDLDSPGYSPASLSWSRSWSQRWN